MDAAAIVNIKTGTCGANKNTAKPTPWCAPPAESTELWQSRSSPRTPCLLAIHMKRYFTEWSRGRWNGLFLLQSARYRRSNPRGRLTVRFPVNDSPGPSVCPVEKE